MYPSPSCCHFVEIIHKAFGGGIYDKSHWKKQKWIMTTIEISHQVCFPSQIRTSILLMLLSYRLSNKANALQITKAITCFAQSEQHTYQFYWNQIRARCHIFCFSICICTSTDNISDGNIIVVVIFHFGSSYSSHQKQ